MRRRPRTGRRPAPPGTLTPPGPPTDRPATIPGILRVVATPIGNLEDLAPRAVRALAECKVVACEDTRVTRTILDRHGLRTPLVACHKFNESGVVARLLAILAEGSDVALVSDGGTPGLSDPGAILVRAAHAAGYAVRPIPGPSAATAIWSASGFSGPFTVAGFLPHRQGERRRALESWRATRHAIVFFESPHRILDMLEDAVAVLGDRPACLGREITKLHEEIVRGRLAAIRERLRSRTVRGEFAVVIGPADEPATSGADAMAEAIAEARRSIAAGAPLSEAARRAAREHGVPRRDLYRRLLERVGADAGEEE